MNTTDLLRLKSEPRKYYSDLVSRRLLAIVNII
jgi:hypothetical protein